MSRIMIHVYDGDADQYDPDNESDTVGERDHERSADFRDGEELNAVEKIARLLDEGKHFDVRQWRN